MSTADQKLRAGAAGLSDASNREAGAVAPVDAVREVGYHRQRVGGAEVGHSARERDTGRSCNRRRSHGHPIQAGATHGDQLLCASNMQGIVGQCHVLTERRSDRLRREIDGQIALRASIQRQAASAVVGVSGGFRKIGGIRKAGEDQRRVAGVVDDHLLRAVAAGRANIGGGIRETWRLRITDKEHSRIGGIGKDEVALLIHQNVIGGGAGNKHRLGIAPSGPGLGKNAGVDRVGDKDGSIRAHRDGIGIVHPAADDGLRIARIGKCLLDDLTVAGIGDIQVAAGIQGDLPRLIQAGDEGGRRGICTIRERDFIDRSVIEAGEVDIALRVDGQAGGKVEARGDGGLHPASAGVGFQQDLVVAAVADVHVSRAVNRNRLGVAQTAGHRTLCIAARRQCLFIDSILVVVNDIDIAAGVHGSGEGVGEVVGRK